MRIGSGGSYVVAVLAAALPYGLGAMGGIYNTVGGYAVTAGVTALTAAFAVWLCAGWDAE